MRLESLERWTPPAIAAAVALSVAPAAWAQATSSATNANAPAGMTSTEKTTETVTVVSFDPNTRRLVVQTAAGETEAIRVPEEFRNVQNLKPGDRIKATYYVEAEFSLAPANKPLPENTQTMVAGRTASGQLPGGAIANHVVVTGAVVGVDAAAHTLRVVNPQGGEVHTIHVRSPEGRKLLGQLKPGDKITADITEALLITTERG
jgi:hypothetical protein